MPPTSRAFLQTPYSGTRLPRRAPVSHPPPSLHNMNFWGYLALIFVILAIAALLTYAIYSCCHSAKQDHIHLSPENAHSTPPVLRPAKQHSKKRKRREGSESNSTLPMIYRDSQTPPADSPFTAPGPPPGLARSHSARFSPNTPPYIASHPFQNLAPDSPSPNSSRSNLSKNSTNAMLMFDSNHIRFVAPQTVAMSKSTSRIWADPKLSPVQGHSEAAVPETSLSLPSRRLGPEPLTVQLAEDLNNTVVERF